MTSVKDWAKALDDQQREEDSLRAEGAAARDVQWMAAIEEVRPDPARVDNYQRKIMNLALDRLIEQVKK